MVKTSSKNILKQDINIAILQYSDIEKYCKLQCTTWCDAPSHVSMLAAHVLHLIVKTNPTLAPLQPGSVDTVLTIQMLTQKIQMNLALVAWVAMWVHCNHMWRRREWMGSTARSGCLINLIFSHVVGVDRGG